LNIGAVHGGIFFGLIFENVYGPEQTVDADAKMFKLRGQPAVDHTDAAHGGA
jgi:hypothetical protein